MYARSTPHIPHVAFVLTAWLAGMGCSKSNDVSAVAQAPAPGTAAPANTLHVAPALLPALPAPPDVASPPPNAEKSASGLVSVVLQPGTGTVHPEPGDVEYVSYAGWRKDGVMFDRSGKHPYSINLNQVVRGWTEGLKLMVAGEKRRLWIPAVLAFGDTPRPSGYAEVYGDVVIDVELVKIDSRSRSVALAMLATPQAPADVAAPPAVATKTKSGLAYVVLTKQSKGAHPKSTDTVRVSYTGWTIEGKVFDSSMGKSAPASFRLDQMIKGWSEGLQLMRVGEKARFWIPAELANGDHPARTGGPAGPLVFEVELLGIG
jgi:FKBP-type peptidyl-prolyl cis-trans isomerase